MKKILFTLMLMIGTLTVSAQAYVGGSLGFRYFSEATGTETKAKFKFTPEIGAVLSDSWSMAVALGFDITTPEEGGTVCEISINPYVRYNFIKAGNFKVFIDGGFTYTNRDDELNDWNVAIKPGLSYTINEKFSIVSHLGDGLIYRDGDNKSKNGIAFDIANSLSFGLYYSF